MVQGAVFAAGVAALAPNVNAGADDVERFYTQRLGALGAFATNPVFAASALRVRDTLVAAYLTGSVSGAQYRYPALPYAQAR